MSEDIKNHKKYCVVCQRDIYPSNFEEFISGEHDGRIYVHDKIDHPEDFEFDKPVQ